MAAAVVVKELSAPEAMDKLRTKTKELALSEAQLKVYKLRNVQLEANNRMLMLLSVGLCIVCGVFAYDAKLAAQSSASSTPILSTPTTQTGGTYTTKIGTAATITTPTTTPTEECDLVVHYDTQYGAGVYAGA
jgi:hypothetical protein